MILDNSLLYVKVVITSSNLNEDGLFEYSHQRHFPTLVIFGNTWWGNLIDENLVAFLYITQELLNCRPLNPTWNYPTDLEATTTNQLLSGPWVLRSSTCDIRRNIKTKKAFSVAQARTDCILPEPSFRCDVNCWSSRKMRGLHQLGRVKKCHFRNGGDIRSCDVLTQWGMVSRLTIRLSPY